MNCADLLRKLGPMEAAQVASIMRMPIEAVYTELVAQEARGNVEVRVLYAGRAHEHRLWAPVAS